MIKYYTRVCNFYYGKKSIKLVNQKKTYPLNGNINISFDKIEIISRNKKKTIHIKKINKLPLILKTKVKNNIKTNIKNKNVLLDIYDFFEHKIKFLRRNGINHNNIILDPGIGFGKKLKHNMSLISNVSIFHSLGFPILLGLSRKRFIKDISLFPFRGNVLFLFNKSFDSFP